MGKSFRENLPGFASLRAPGCRAASLVLHNLAALGCPCRALGLVVHVKPLKRTLPQRHFFEVQKSKDGWLVLGRVDDIRTCMLLIDIACLEHFKVVKPL